MGESWDSGDWRPTCQSSKSQLMSQKTDGTGTQLQNCKPLKAEITISFKHCLWITDAKSTQKMPNYVLERWLQVTKIQAVYNVCMDMTAHQCADSQSVSLLRVKYTLALCARPVCSFPHHAMPHKLSPIWGSLAC